MLATCLVQPTKYPSSEQKPIKLCEYLVKTYSNEGQLVLDNTMGSGTTGIACVNTNRQFIGIESDTNYFKLAQERIQPVNKVSHDSPKSPIESLII